jgi:hypothetical protein
LSLILGSYSGDDARRIEEKEKEDKDMFLFEDQLQKLRLWINHPYYVWYRVLTATLHFLPA